MSETILSIAAPIGVALAMWLSRWVAKMIQTKVQNDALAGALLRLNDAVFAAVKELEQSVVGPTKAQAGGRLSVSEARGVKKKAIEVARQHLGGAGVSEVTSALGIPESALEKHLGSRIEAAVSDLRRSTHGPFPPGK